MTNLSRPDISAEAPSLAARMTFRRETRKLLAHPEELSTHLSRLAAALEMNGSEPAQGALADLFSRLGVEAGGVKKTALGLVAERLPPHARRAFEARLELAPLRSPTPLATRWSVLAQPSVDIPMRARRCSPDDSRGVAAEGAEAIATGDLDGVSKFIEHCITCRDNLAFMLARRATLKAGLPLPEGWAAAAALLEQPAEAT